MVRDITKRNRCQSNVSVTFFLYLYRLNLLIIFTSMGFVAHSPPNFAAAQTSLGVPPGPIVTELFAHLPLFSQVSRFAFFIIIFELNRKRIQVNGIMNMV